MRWPPEIAARAIRGGTVAAAAVVWLWATPVSAIELLVEPRQISVDESVRVTLALDGELASLDAVDLPLDNLETSGPPSVSSQFTIIGGTMNRKKTFTWWVSPVNPGVATVGPLQLETRDGGLVLVPSVEVRVLPPSDVGATGPSDALDRLYLAGRDEVVLVAEAEPSTAVVGQEVIVTWTLYSAVSLRGFAVTSIPELESFWVEEDLAGSRSPRSARIGGHEVQKVDVRRASLFPLRHGDLEIPPLEVRVEVVRPFRDPFGGFSLLEGRVAEVRRRSAPISVHVRQSGVKADAVGRFRMTRSEPVVSPEGLVAFDVTVEGAGSLRSMGAPGLSGPVAGEIDVQEVESDVTGRSPLRMKRVWRYVIFPSKSGLLTIPAIETDTVVPGAASARTLRTDPVTVDVTLSEAAALSGIQSAPLGERMGPRTTAILAGVLVVGVGAILLVMVRRRIGETGELRRITAAAGHTITLRKRLEETVVKRGRNPVLLYGESSDLGDAWRAAMSLVDRMEKEPESIETPEREVRVRARRLLDALAD